MMYFTMGILATLALEALFLIIICISGGDQK